MANKVDQIKFFIRSPGSADKIPQTGNLAGGAGINDHTAGNKKIPDFTECLFRIALNIF